MRGAILAGGAASRYGGAPKGLVTVAGRRILDRVVDAVQAVTGALPLLIANAPGASAWRPDLQPFQTRDPATAASAASTQRCLLHPSRSYASPGTCRSFLRDCCGR